VIYSVQAVVQASRPGGQNIGRAEFVDTVRADPAEADSVTFDRGPHSASNVKFRPVRLREYRTAADPYEAFAAALTAHFREIGRWIDARPNGGFDRVRAGGITVRLFIDVWMDQDQMDVELPVELLAGCARAGLPMFLISNDIPADQMLSWGAT
jgi:hypothetical protein